MENWSFLYLLYTHGNKYKEIAFIKNQNDYFNVFVNM